LPRLGDASTAVVGRILPLLLTRSWLGKEDHGLEQRLHAELPAILNWALDGLERLVENGGRFTRLPSAEEAIIAMRDLASPVAAFVREECEIKSDAEVEADKLYTAYKTWCDANEHPKASKQLFGRDLRAAVPSIRPLRPRSSDSPNRPRMYIGIRPR
jgi:putative DNA primase/helicase